MRIIAGEYKGRVVKFPKSKLVRPTTDRTKESLFNYLNNKINFDDINVCDIYAGSGSLGLEALSRGAGEIHFVEKNFNVAKILRENIASLGAENFCHVYKMEAVKFSRMSEHISYDLILADPPFFHDDIHRVVENLMENNFLNEGGILIIERSVQTESKDTAAFGIEASRKIGDSLIYEFG